MTILKLQWKWLGIIVSISPHLCLIRLENKCELHSRIPITVVSRHVLFKLCQKMSTSLWQMIMSVGKKAGVEAMKCGFVETCKGDEQMNGEDCDFTWVDPTHWAHSSLSTWQGLMLCCSDGDFCVILPHVNISCCMLQIYSVLLYILTGLPHNWFSVIFIELNSNLTSDVKFVSTSKLFNISGESSFSSRFPRKNGWRIHGWTNESDCKTFSFLHGHIVDY